MMCEREKVRRMCLWGVGWKGDFGWAIEREDI